jgi:hypothetical protein
MLAPLFHCPKKGDPVLMDEDQDRVADFAGEGLIAVKLLDAMKDFHVRKVFPFMDICLPDLVSGLVMEVFGSEGRSINGPVAWVAFLLNSMSASCMLFLCLYLLHNSLGLALRSTLSVKPSGQ